ncbi:DUF998 domain-containing protein [Halobacteriales archaeon Cl-PHB]
MDRLAVERWAGAAGVLVTFAAILVATLVSPAFRWTAHALSNLGVTATAPGTGTTVVLFNGGLILGGLVSLGFAHYLVQTAETGLGTAAGVSFGLTTLLLAAIGVFPQDQSLHVPVAVGFYLLVSVTLALAGVAAYRRRDRTWAAVSVGLGAVNLAVWVAWGMTGGVRRGGLAIPEILGALAFALWVVLAVRRPQ